MANMIIKPAGNGNLLIQDRAGGAVLSTGTSGATIASGVTGGAGLSGMTSLGTVTAGNLSNSAIVYPAGHVIKTATDYWQPSAQWSPGAATATPLSISFTPISSSSKLHLFAYFGMVNQTTTPTTRTLFNFHKGGTLLSPGGSSYGVLYLGENTSGTNYYQDASMFLVISSYSGAATIDVRITGDATRNVHTNSNNWLTIQEVAQ